MAAVHAGAPVVPGQLAVLEVAGRVGIKLAITHQDSRYWANSDLIKAMAARAQSLGERVMVRPSACGCTRHTA